MVIHLNTYSSGSRVICYLLHVNCFEILKPCDLNSG
nr:MAG TPA: hypothetical protein [Caudoviricetes sp.]